MEVGERNDQSFDLQFNDRKTLEASAGNLSYVEISTKFPNPNNNEPPLLFLPGWSITLGTAKGLVEDLSKGESKTWPTKELDKSGDAVWDSSVHYGRNVIACEFPRFGGKIESKLNFADEIVRQAELIGELVKKQDGKMDIAADSMAVMSLIAAIRINPEMLDKINNIMFVSPAGVSGNDNLINLVSRSLVHFGQDALTFARSPIERANIVKMGINSGLYVAKNLPRTAREVMAIAKSEQYGALKELKSEFDQRGIMLGFMQADSDKLTPANKLWDRIGEETHSAWKELTQEDIDAEPKYRHAGRIVNGKKMVWDRNGKSDKPPMHTIVMVEGGHDNRLYAQRGFGVKILREFENLELMKSNTGTKD